MNLKEKSEQLKSLLKQKYKDREYWKNCKTKTTFSFIDGTTNEWVLSNEYETELEIEAIEYWLKDIKKVLNQDEELDGVVINELSEHGGE